MIHFLRFNVVGVLGFALQTGALFALPYVGNSQLFFYRKDLFEKHNLKKPDTWQDVLTAAKTIDESEKSGSPSANGARTALSA